MFLGLSGEALALVAFAAVLVGVSKAGFGGGVGVVATPLVALAMPVADAAALMLPVLIGTDFFTVGHFRRTLSGPDLRLLLPATLVGVLAGALTFEALAGRDRALEIAVGLIALAFVAWQALFPMLTGRLQEARPPSRLWGSAMGAIAGFGSTIAHAGGPPITVYLLPRRLPRQVFVGTTAWLFFILNLVKLVPYAILGLLTAPRLGLALALLPLSWLGTWLGVRMLRGFDERLFTRAVMALLLITGVQLLVNMDLADFFGSPGE